MYKYKLAIVLLFFIHQNLFAQTPYFDTNCKNCHFAQNQLNMFMERYILKYSSEKMVKNAIFNYIKNPKIENSVMPSGFLNRFGVKEASTIDDESLIKSIDEYYQLYSFKIE